MINTIRFFVLSLLVLAVLALTGCEKDENGPDKSSLLTAHIWKYNNLSTTSTDTDIQMFVNMMAGFMTGSTLNFSTDGTLSLTVLGMTETATWELNADGTQITIDKGTEDEGVQNIVTLTSDVLEFTETSEDEDFGNIVLKYKWVK